MARTLKVFFHDACFDGTASAALFSAFYREVIDPKVQVGVHGMQHRDGDPFEGVAIDGDDNACVDFRYTPSERMHWWFDHHPTGFQPPTLRAHFTRDLSGRKFFDPGAPSCAGLIARSLERAWSWGAPPHLRELVDWADTIDAARFSSVDDATSIARPAQQMALWVSQNRSGEAAARYIDILSREGLESAAADPELAVEVVRVEAQRRETRSVLRSVARRHGDIVEFDLLDQGIMSSPGFLGYQLFPECGFAVSVVRGNTTLKVGVGRNPWVGSLPEFDVGALCESLGGGGHAAVGGITLRLDEVPRARAAVAAIIAALAAAR
jgi:hypothetical protein